jgi:hypothetical protein
MTSIFMALVWASMALTNWPSSSCEILVSRLDHVGFTAQGHREAGRAKAPFDQRRIRLKVVRRSRGKQLLRFVRRERRE